MTKNENRSFIFAVMVHVNLLALTATATVSTRSTIIRILGMKDPAVTATSPDKANLSFCVKERRTIENTIGTVIDKLRVERSAMQRVMIFCRKYKHCADLYMTIFIAH